MSSLAASPVRTCLVQARAPACPEPVRDSTGNWCEPFAWFDRDTQSWRTWQTCLVEGLALFSQTWPRSALMLNGIAFRRAPSAPLTSATASGSLPTPRANRWGLEDSHGSRAAWDRLLPSPRASDADKGGRGDLLTVLRGYETKHAGTLPTPQARDWKDGRFPKQHGQHSPSLPVAIATRGGPGRMNPRFREWMMGLPIGWTELAPPETDCCPKSRS